MHGTLWNFLAGCNDLACKTWSNTEVLPVFTPFDQAIRDHPHILFLVESPTATFFKQLES